MGYREAIRAHAHPRLEEWVEFGDPGDVSTIQNLISQIRPDAIVCANDYTAGQLMTSLNALGIRVPSEIMVIGMDDIRYASVLQTPLTTIHQPCLNLGASALAAMLDRASQPKMPACDFTVDFKLVLRLSTDRSATDAFRGAR